MGGNALLPGVLDFCDSHGEMCCLVSRLMGSTGLDKKKKKKETYMQTMGRLKFLFIFFFFHSARERQSTRDMYVLESHVLRACGLTQFSSVQLVLHRRMQRSSQPACPFPKSFFSFLAMT